VLDDVVVGAEDPVAKPVVAAELPDISTRLSEGVLMFRVSAWLAA
jgi:hypothetical protein